VTAILRPESVRARIFGAVLLALLASVAGCQSRGKVREAKHATPESLYKNARKALTSNDYEFSIKQYEALTARFPFSDESRQARLDLIYVYYRKGENESATDAAEQFLRENPTHPRVDYAWYMKGLIDFEKTPWAFERWFGVDTAKRPPASLGAAISAFGTVVRQYPKSAYAHDAQRRMIYLRNRLAEYEINVARYYLKRGAYDAAALRAHRVIEQYDGAPATKAALEIMIECYQRLGFKELQASTESVYQANFSGDPGKSVKRRWWHLW
jgi:outer membrane protein assembly factor BamD